MEFVRERRRVAFTPMTTRSGGPESLVQNWAAKGAICAGAIGAVAGFVYAWTVNESTAWFGIIEAGVPAFVLGGMLGAASGVVATMRRHTAERHHGTRSP